MPYPVAAAPASPLARLIQPVKKAIAAEVVGLFNDRARWHRTMRRYGRVSDNPPRRRRG